MKKFTLAQQFKQYFKVIKADTDELKDIVYKIRYEVFSKEFKYEQDCPIDCEQDEFDSYSHYFLVQHLSTGVYAGCIRLVIPPEDNPQLLLPFEKYCMTSVHTKKLNYITQFGRTSFGEISRLAVLGSFVRRKNLSENNPYGLKIHHLSAITKDEIRFFPFIAVSLFLATTVLISELGLNHAVVMMELPLARLLTRYGIHFTQIGNTMEYNGQRALFYSDIDTFFNHLKPEFMEFYKLIKSDLGITSYKC